MFGRCGWNRYPIQGSVRMYFGRAGSASIFFRSWLITTRKFAVSSP